MVIAFEIVERTLSHRTHDVRDVLFGMYVPNARLGTLLCDVIADRMDEVGLAEPHAAVNEKRVVGDAGILGHLDRRRTRELVRLAGHEAVEGKAAIQARAFD